MKKAGLSYYDVARKFEVDPRTVRRWVREYALTKGKTGLGPVFRKGKIVVIPEEAIERFQERHTGY